MTLSGVEHWGNHLRPLLHVFPTILANWESSDPLSLSNENKSLFVWNIWLGHRGRGTVFRDEETAFPYALLEVQDSLQFIGNFSLETFQFQYAQEDLPALMVEEKYQELDSERFRKAVDKAVQSLKAGKSAFFDVFVGCVLPGVSSSNPETPAVNQGAPHIGESRVFFLDAPGTRKRFATRGTHDFLRFRETKVIEVARSAAAAVLLDEGRTAHSTFKYRHVA